MTGPEQHAATVLEVLSWEAPTPKPESWGGKRAEARDALDELVALARDNAIEQEEFDELGRRLLHHKSRAEAAEARADELERERDALREAAQISDKLELGWHEPYMREMEKRQAAESRADELQRERDEFERRYLKRLDHFEQARRDALDYQHAYTDANEQLEQARREADQLRAALRRAATVAENLMGMIDRETWRTTGGDDGQGHYEGDYRAERVADEIREWAALAGVQAHGYGPDAGISFPDDGGTITVEPDPTLRAYSRDRGGVQADNKDSA